MTTCPGREAGPSQRSAWFGHEDGHLGSGSGVVSVPHSVHRAAVIWPHLTPHERRCDPRAGATL